MTLTVRLGPEEEKKLLEIEQALNINDRSKVIRELINEKWQALQPTRTFVDRRGGHPVNLLSGSRTDSDHFERKGKMSEHFADKSRSRKVDK